jgi:transcription elongation regulator 1
LRCLSTSQAREGFKSLLEEASTAGTVTATSTSKDLEAIYGEEGANDGRWAALEAKEREAMIKEVVEPLKREIEERESAETAAATAAFRQLLTSAGVDAHARWSKWKEQLTGQAPCETVPKAQREVLFRAFVAELAAAETSEKDGGRSKEEELRGQREREVRKRKEREEEEMAARRLKAQRQDVLESFQSLLTEQVKDPDSSWREYWPKLERDPQGRATSRNVDNTTLEKYFRDHVAKLYDRGTGSMMCMDCLWGT